MTGRVKSESTDAQGVVKFNEWEGISMKINRNMSAVITNRQLLRTENKLTASMERLSSGYKINKAGDNPAGIAISNKMKAQIDALDQATSNATDGISVLKIADGALNEVSSILQRVRELSVQAANGTNSYDDRKSIQAEIDKLTEEVDRISSDTEYNTKTLLDGSSDVRVYSKQATRLDVSDSVLPDTYYATVNAPAERATYEIPAPSGNAAGTISINDVTMEYVGGMSEESFYEELRQTAEKAGCLATKTATGYAIQTAEYGSDEEIKLEFNKSLAQDLGIDPADDDVSIDEDTGAYVVNKAGKDTDMILTQGAGLGFSKTATVSADGLRVKVTDVGGFSMDFLLNEPQADANGTVTYDAQLAIEVTDIGAMKIQIGANQYQEMAVRIPEVSSESLYLDKVNVTVAKGPEKAMVTMDEAIAKLNEVRSRIGAFQNRLEYAESSLAETEEDMTNAYSGILDTDMAEEMTEYTQQNVLSQAAISVLSQANDLPQQVLSLLQ